MFTRASVFLIAAALFVACDSGSNATDATATVDATTARDAAAGRDALPPDLGTTPDSGVTAADAETADSGAPVDSGVAEDTGVAVDSGVAEDSGVAADSGVAGPLSFAADVYPTISANCSCHVFGASGGLSMSSASTAYQNLHEIASTCDPSVNRVSSSNAAGSLIWRKVAGMNLCGERMPYGGPYLDAMTVQLFADWIDEGARP